MKKFVKFCCCFCLFGSIVMLIDKQYDGALFYLILFFALIILLNKNKIIKNYISKKEINKEKILKTNNISKTQNPFKKLNDKYLNNEYISLYNRMQYDFAEEAQYYNNHCCPNCDIVFDNEVKTSECKKQITKRSNYITKQGYLIGTNKLCKYMNYEQKLRDLHFYEDILKNISYMGDIREYVKECQKKFTSSSIRELVWNILNELSNQYLNKGYNILMSTLYH